MSIVSKKDADMLLSNFCHLPHRGLQLRILNHIAEFTREDATYVFPSSITDSKNVFPDLMELYIAIKEHGRGKASTEFLAGNEMVFIGSDVNTYRKQLMDPRKNVSDSVGKFHALPFTLASVKDILITYGAANFSTYFFSDRLDAYGTFVRDFLWRYDQFMAWENSKKEDQYRQDANFVPQVNILVDKETSVAQKVTAAYNLFTWAGIEFTEDLTRTLEPWRTLRADTDGLEMIEKLVADTYANKVDPFSNPVCAGLDASIEAEPEYDAEITEEDQLAEVVTADLAAKALCAYNKSIDYNALVKVRANMISFSINHDMLAQHIYQYRGQHEIHLIPTTPALANGKVCWRYVLEDQNKKLYLLFSNTSKNSEIYGLHVDPKDPSKMELIVIEKDKHNRYTFTG